MAVRIRKRVKLSAALAPALEFPTVEEILALHEQLVALTGGERGVRHRGGVEAALERARWGPFEGEGDLAERAALLLRGIALDHPFVDGNKRTAHAAAEAFLVMNGHEIEADEEDVVSFMVAVARDERGLDDIVDWLRARLRRL